MQILPVAALAAVTKNAVQAIFAVLAIAASMALAAALLWFDLLSGYDYDVTIASRLPSDTNLIWIEVTLAAATLAAGSVAVLTMQYARRGTTLSRAVLAATLVLAGCSVLLPHSAKWAIQMKSSPQRIDANDYRIWGGGVGGWPSGGPNQDHSAPNDTPVSLSFSLRLDQPFGIRLNAESFQATAEAPSGQSWSPQWTLENVQIHQSEIALSVSVDRDFYNRVKATPVHFYGTFDFTLLADAQTIPVPGQRSVSVPGIGRCSGPPKESLLVSCDSTLPRARLVPAVENEARWNDSSSSVLAPFPYSPGYSPLTAVAVLLPGVFHSHPQQVSFLIEKPIAYVQRRFDFGNIVLANAEASPSNAPIYR
jgi:hypothetical protein